MTGHHAVWVATVAATGALSAVAILSSLVLAERLAGKALEAKGTRPGRLRLWKASCLAAALLPTTVVLTVLAVLVLVTATAANVPAGGVGLILAVAAGVVGNHIDRQVSTGWTPYWEHVHDSLRRAMPVVERTSRGIPDCQRTRFNTTHVLLHDRDGRADTLEHILRGEVCTKARPCAGHGVSQRREQTPVTRLPGAGVILFTQAPVLAVMLAGWLIVGSLVLLVTVLIPSD